jgi:phosphate acyltransferase
MAIRVAVDAMGGDHAPDVVIEGAVMALREAPDSLHILLVGPEETVRKALENHPVDGLPITVLDAPEVIGMDESPAAAVKGKPRSSIHVGLGAHKEGHADAFVSAGNTGAVMAAAVFGLGRLEGVARPALPSPYPTVRGRCTLLDVGANMDCKPEHLLQFAQMGSIYVERVLGVASPAVGLLNVGEEPSKGNEAAKAAHQLLSEADSLRFIGNIEGRDIMLHAADVVVCDGFVGNILLKLGESIKTVLPALVRDEVQKVATSGGGSEAAGLLQQVMGGLAKRFSYEEFGGTPLLGVDGTVLIGHGGSSARAVARMIEAAAEMVRADLRQTIASALAQA